MSKSDEVADAPDYTVVKGLEKARVGKEKIGIREIAERAQVLRLKIAVEKAELDNLNALGAEVLLKHDVKSVMVDNLKVTRVESSNSHISRELLLKYGVSEKVVDKSTKRSEYTTLKVTEKKEKGKGEE